MATQEWDKLLRAALVAFILFACSAAGWLIYDGLRFQSAYEQKAEAKAKGYADRANIATERRCVPLAAAQEFDCRRQENQTARQGAHDEYDLQSQLVTSVWTRQMGIAAIIGMAVGVLGVGLIFVTYSATRKTLAAFIAVERAALVPSVAGGNTDGDRIKIGMVISNVGRSSAHIYHVRFTALENAYPEGKFKGYRRISQVIKPDQTLEFPEAVSIPSNLQKPFVGGYVEYQSRFGTHKSYFNALLTRKDREELAYGGHEFSAESAKPEQDWPEDT